jgi:AcrR family transcriptional regulator
MPTERFIQLHPAKKTVIEHAILNEMMRHTYEHLNLSNIVNDSNISRGSLYQYFKNKHDLYFYMMQQMSTMKRTYFNLDIIQSQSIIFHEKIKYLLKQSFLFAKEHPNWLLVAQNLYASKDPAIIDFVQETHIQSKKLYKTLLLSDSAYQSKDNIEHLVNFINETMLFFSQLLYQHRALNDVYQLIETYIRVLEGGLSHV